MSRPACAICCGPCEHRREAPGHVPSESPLGFPVDGTAPTDPVEAAETECRELTVRRRAADAKAQATWIAWNDARIAAAEKAAGGET